MGAPFLVDPGTYCYTAYPEERNRFRSAMSHNTISVDGEEQNEFGRSVFGFDAYHATGRILRWESGPKEDLLVCEHYAYRRLDDPVVHRRAFTLDKIGKVLIVGDSLLAKGNHRYRWTFQLHPEVRVIKRDSHSWLLRNGEARVMFWHDLPEPTLDSGEVSFAYLHKETAPRIVADRKISWFRSKLSRSVRCIARS